MEWDEIDPTTQEDLIEWYNVSELDNSDRQLLADLVEQGQFTAWDCSYCGERIRRGDPSNWNDFQGVCQDESYGNLCSDCGSKLLTLQGLV